MGAERERKSAYNQVFRVAKLWHSYNPPAEYLQLLEWDGVPRLDKILVTYFGAEDTPYAQMVGSRHMIALVACAMDPGCKVDTVLVLEGDQGAQKSAGIKILGGDWYDGTAHDIESKDALIQVTQCWVFELQEMSRVNRADVEEAKSYLSTEKVRFRPPYGRAFRRFNRRCVFFGTTNKERYLRDPTGARRFWPIYVPGCDTEALERDRDQLFAEAVARYRSAALNPHLAHRKCPGERWWLDKDEQKEADKVTALRLISGPMAAKIREAMERDKKQAGVRAGEVRYYTTEGIAQDVLSLSVLEAERSEARITVAMRAAGMEATDHRVSKTDRRRLWIYNPTAEEDPDPGVTASPAAAVVAPAPAVDELTN